MLSQSQRTTILELNARGISTREIARAMKLSRLSVRKVLRSGSDAVPEIQRPEKALAAVRRMMRPDGAAPLPAVRSLAYFLPVIDEVLGTDVDPHYYQHVRNKLQRLAPAR